MMNGEGHRQRGTTEKTTAGVARCEEGIAREKESPRNVLEEGESEASKNEPNLSHDFCVASLEEASTKSKPLPSSLKDLVGMSIQLTISSRAIIVSLILELLKNETFDHFRRCRSRFRVQGF
ncbi:hypothetical protein RJT34_12449 [Clitoria ternatea]|uniref:Uncharacterized protein n=1 Tax=Clitoria ternatea TaxID=43366 RepID=A0AAN9JPJ0_CLITE